MKRQKITLFITMMVFLLSYINTARDAATAAGKDESKALNDEKVLFAGNGVKMPLMRIVLVRKDSLYCAIKFTKFWTGKTKYDLFADYESYYQGDGTGDFSKKNVEVKKEQLSEPRLVGLGRTPFSWHTGPVNKDIKCGPIKLDWSGGGTVYFYSLAQLAQGAGDYGIQLAPTPWTDIKEVNVFDPRVKWYRYDERLKRYWVPVEQLWEDKGDKK